MHHGDDGPAPDGRETPSTGGSHEQPGTSPGQGLQLPDSESRSTAPRAESPAGASRPVRGRVEERRERDQGSSGNSKSEVVERLRIEADRVEVSQSWSAPLPPPEVLADYERLLPGAALRILAMAETSVTGQIEADKKVVAAEIEASERGLTFAMRLTVLMTAASVVFYSLAVAGVGSRAAAVTAGSVFLSLPVIMLIRSFIARS